MFVFRNYEYNQVYIYTNTCMSSLPRIVRNFGRCCHTADADDASTAAAGTGTAAAHAATDDARGHREIRLLAGLLLLLQLLRLRLMLHFYGCRCRSCHDCCCCCGCVCWVFNNRYILKMCFQYHVAHFASIHLHTHTRSIHTNTVRTLKRTRVCYLAG